MEELKAVVMASPRSKSSGFDRWTYELFMEWFDFLGKDFLRDVEDSRIRGAVSRAMNSNFVVLIPQKLASANLGHYCQISLCNYVYKFIAKIIANHLKPELSRGLLSEQFVFLQNG